MFFCDYPILRNEKELPIYLITMGQHYCQDHIIRPEGYPYAQILYCTKGSGILIADGKRIDIPPYSAIFLPAHFPHEYFANEEEWDIHWIVPCGFACDDVLNHFGLTEMKVFELDNINMLEHIFRKMHEAIRTDSIYGCYKASGYLYDFLIEFNRIVSLKGKSGRINTALMKAVDYINDRFASQITMDDLCNAANVSKQHLCLLFRQELGTRPMEYIAKRRLQAAKELLTGTTDPIEIIAEKTGFCGCSYFCKLFRRYEGMTPSQFRSVL